MRFWKRRQRLLQVRRLFLACGYEIGFSAFLALMARAWRYEAIADIYQPGPHFVY